MGAHKPRRHFVVKDPGLSLRSNTARLPQTSDENQTIRARGVRLWHSCGFSIRAEGFRRVANYEKKP